MLGPRRDLRCRRRCVGYHGECRCRRGRVSHQLRDVAGVRDLARMAGLCDKSGLREVRGLQEVAGLCDVAGLREAAGLDSQELRVDLRLPSSSCMPN